MTPGCLHECARCEGIFECAGGGCGLGFFERLCSLCLRLGYQMGECARCERLVPIQDSRWGCDECVRQKLEVA